MGGSTSHIHVRFAVASLVVCAAVGLLAVVVGRDLARTAQERAAAQSAARLVAAPVHAALKAAAPADRAAAVEAASRPLLSDGTMGLRVWGPDGSLLFAGGLTDPPPEQAPERAGISWSWTQDAEAAPLFVSHSAVAGVAVEVFEDGAPLRARIRGEQSTIMAITIAAFSLLYAALQGVFTFVVAALIRDHRRLLKLYVAGEDLRSSLDLQDVLSRVTRDVTAAAKGQFGLAALFEQETGDILLRVTYDHRTGIIDDHQRSVEEWFLRRCIVTRTAIISGQAATAYEQFFGPDFTDEGQVNVLCVPMSLRDRVVGVVATVRPPGAGRSGFAADDVRQAVDLAAQAAMAIEQAQLFAKVRAYANEVEISYDSTLKALMAALDAKDEVTEGHCERVAKLTVHLARQIGVKDGALVDIERGALLHDVGKIGVPDAVLRKPAALDEWEWEAMRKHPLLAGVMVSKVGFLEGATPILLYHHERYDGNGYPFRLAGEQIPMEARIFSVVDAYDAMTSDRPYRAAMSHAAAMEELRANSGTQFDPHVVAAFEQLMARRPELRTRVPARRDGPHEDAA